MWFGTEATTRQVRLYMVACCRLLSADFFDPRIERALGATELCADDPNLEGVANAVWNEMGTSPQPRLPQTGLQGELARIITGIWQLLDECWGGMQYRTARHAISHAAYLCLRDQPGCIFTGGEGDAAYYCARAVESAESLLLGMTPEEVEQDDNLETESEIRRAISNVLRDIFGNPFRPVTIDTAWLTPTVKQIAPAIYEEKAFDRMPVLADALEESGCTSEDILNHLRQSGVHVKGCWAVDLILGKE
jgi:hypothetical protein